MNSDSPNRDTGMGTMTVTMKVDYAKGKMQPTSSRGMGTVLKAMQKQLPSFLHEQVADAF